MDPRRTLREARRSGRLSQRALAQLAGVPQPTVARIESGAVTPRLDTLERLLAPCGLELAVARRPGAGIDRTPIRALRLLTPAERVRRAAREARNLERLLAAATTR